MAECYVTGWPWPLIRPDCCSTKGVICWWYTLSALCALKIFGQVQCWFPYNTPTNFYCCTFFFSRQNWITTKTMQFFVHLLSFFNQHEEMDHSQSNNTPPAWLHSVPHSKVHTMHELVWIFLHICVFVRCSCIETFSVNLYNALWWSSNMSIWTTYNDAFGLCIGCKNCMEKDGCVCFFMAFFPNVSNTVRFHSGNTCIILSNTNIYTDCSSNFVINSLCMCLV